MDAVIKWNGEGMSFEGVGPRDYSVTMGGERKKVQAPWKCYYWDWVDAQGWIASW